MDRFSVSLSDHVLCVLSAGVNEPSSSDPGLCGLPRKSNGSPQWCHRGRVWAHQVWQRGWSHTKRDAWCVQLCCQGTSQLSCVQHTFVQYIAQQKSSCFAVALLYYNFQFFILTHTCNKTRLKPSVCLTLCSLYEIQKWQLIVQIQSKVSAL